MSALQRARSAADRPPRPVRGLLSAVTAACARRAVWPTLSAAAVCLASFAAFWVAQRVSGVSMIDVMVYRAAGWTVRHGHDLYAMRATSVHLPMTYPPFAALLFAPLTLLGVPGMRTLATAGNLALLVAVVHLSLRLTGRTRRAPHPGSVLLLSALAVWCEPVWTTLRYGQINLLVTALVLWDFTRRPGHRWSGLGTGLAAGIKLTPALFVVFLALYGLVQARRTCRGRKPGRARNGWLRRAAVAAGAFLATVAVAGAVLPRDSYRFWTDVVFHSGRVGYADVTDDQSLRGVLARLLHTADPGPAWQLAAAVVAVAGLGAAGAAAFAGRQGAPEPPAPREPLDAQGTREARAPQETQEAQEAQLPYGNAWSTLACAVTALLISPISWSHHWVWCVPLTVLLGAEALRRVRGRAQPNASRDGGAGRWWAATAAALAAFWSYALWLVPHGIRGPHRPELVQDPGQMLLSAVYPAAGLAFLALTAAVSVRALRRSPGRRGNVPAEAARSRGEADPAAPARAPYPTSGQSVEGPRKSRGQAVAKE